MKSDISNKRIPNMLKNTVFPAEHDEKGKKRRKNHEKRKEKSKVAARNRRGKESEYFNDINDLLPLPSEIVLNIDKSCSLRLFIAYLQLKHFLINMNCTSDYRKKNTFNISGDKLYSEAIDGFLLILNLSGHIVFLSENVIKYLGISQIDMLGHSLYDFSHPCDHEDIKTMLHYEDESECKHRLSLVRMRCTPNKREKKVKKVSYKTCRTCSLSFCSRKLQHRYQDQHSKVPDSGVLEETCPMSSTSYGCPLDQVDKFKYFWCEFKNDGKSEMQAAKISFLRRVARLSLFNRVRSSAIHEELLVELLRLQTERSQLGFFGHVIRMSEDRLAMSQGNYLEVMKCVGKLVNAAKQASHSKLKEHKDQNTNHLRLVSLASPIPHPSNIEILLDNTTFLTRHSVDMKFSYIDPRIHTLLQYDEKDLLNTSMYMYIHPADIMSIKTSFQDLFKKGQCDTDLYRFMVKNGGFVWIVTQATLIYGNKTSSFPQCVVCVHYINSNVIDEDQVIAEEQMNSNEKTYSDCLNANESHTPLQSTDSIFSPRTQDMNIGYLTMKDIGAEIQDFKDDPDDLTHLAPTAGDACIPLDISALSDDDLEDWMLMDTPVYQKTLNSLNENGPILSSPANSPLRSDPFLSNDSMLFDTEKSVSCLEPLSIGCSSEDGNDSVSSDHNAQELMDGAYNMPLEDFPALSVTDSDLWNSSDQTSSSSSKASDPSDEENSLKCSSLARLLQSEIHKNCQKLMQNNSSHSAYSQKTQSYSKVASAKRNNASNKKRTKNCSKSAKSKVVVCRQPSFPASQCSAQLDRSSSRSDAFSSLLDSHSICDKWNTKRNFSNISDKSNIKRQRKDHSANNKGSVLMNLLLDGHDAEYNCDINKVAKTSNKISDVPNKFMPVTLAKLLLSKKGENYNSMDQLMYLTCEEAEVNAPTQDKDNLLTGKDLLNALDDENVQMAQSRLRAT